MIKFVSLVLTGVVGGGLLYLHKKQTNEVVVKTPEPPKPSTNDKMQQCLLDHVEANLTEADRKNKDGTEKTPEELEHWIARKVNDTLHLYLNESGGLKLHPIRAACMEKLYGPGKGVIPNPSRADLLEL